MSVSWAITHKNNLGLKKEKQMTISATARLTTKQKADLDKMNVPSQRAGGLGARLDAMQYGSLAGLTGLTGRSVIEYEVAPVLGATTTIHAAITLLVAAQTSVALTTNPDVPRVLNITGSAGGMSGNVKIYGTDVLGASIYDTIALSGSSTVAGTKAFATVTMVDLPAYTHAGTGDTVAIGVSTTLIGVPSVVKYATYELLHLFGGTNDGGSWAINAAASLNIYTVSGTLDGSTKLTLVYYA
jgi:hypothetical protein